MSAKPSGTPRQKISRQARERKAGGEQMELTDRKKRILRAIVETYIATAEPVGSKVVAER